MAHFVVAGWPSGELAVATHGADPVTIQYRFQMTLMKPVEVLRELVYPLSHFATVAPMIMSWLLFSVAFLFGLYGLFVFLVTLVPFLAYLMKLLEARVYGRAAPAFNAELMSFANNIWSLFPLVPAALLGWLYFILVREIAPVYAVTLVVAASTIFPASLGVLSITQSALQSLNPIAVFRFARETGMDYLLLIVILGGIATALVMLELAGVSVFWLRFGFIYLIFLSYSLLGAITCRHDLRQEVDIPAPLAPLPGAQQANLLKERERVAIHAYGFVSRGNRAGGLAHIQLNIEREANQDDACNWFFNTMLKWENTDAALFFAQTYLHRLLVQDRDPQVLKLLSQCYYANAQFRPAEGDRAAIRELVQRHGRSDLLALLG